PIECAELLVDAALRSPALELVARPEVDEACVTGKPRMDFLDAPEHLLRHPSIVGVALGRGAQLAQVEDLAQVDAEVPAKAEGEGHDVLRESRADRCLEAAVSFRCGLDRGRER